MWRHFVFGGLSFFSLQSHVQQIIIGMIRVIYHIQALLVVIRTTLRHLEKNAQCREN